MGILQSLIHGTIVLVEKHLGKMPFLGPVLEALESSTVLRPATQAFTFNDKPRDANLVVLAFRGTEPFDADDWSTDLDFSFVELDDVIGRLHVGFLEALGLVSRDEIEDSGRRLKENLNDPNKELITGLSLHTIQSMAAKSPGTTSMDFHKHSDMLQTYDIERIKHEIAYRLLGFEMISADLIQLLKENPKAQLVITGHSLGGALAALFAALVLYNNVERNEKKLLVEHLRAVFTFGQPRVGDKVFASFMASTLEKHKVQYYRVVYAYDLVPRIPFDHSIFGFKHFGFCCYTNILYQQMVSRMLVRRLNMHVNSHACSEIGH
ncbi:hypothetical protein GOP47_0029685 [Adiantum capillus-veneris]|nr:hypothetical protein GOP47_0029685 [Adiantum capillus-veneris]